MQHEFFIISILLTQSIVEIKVIDGYLPPIRKTLVRIHISRVCARCFLSVSNMYPKTIKFQLCFQ